MKRQFVVGRITVQRFASKQMRAKHAEDSNARFDTASFFAVRLGLVPPPRLSGPFCRAETSLAQRSPQNL